MNNVMLDLETVGQGSNAAIVALGAVEFDIATGATAFEFYAVIDLKSSLAFGEPIDASTFEWWMQQDTAARQIFFNDERQELNLVLDNFTEWLHKIGKDTIRVWGNGDDFDNVILQNAFKTTGYRDAPWPHYANRNVRNMVDLGLDLLGINPKHDLPFEGTRHNALDDAKHQAKYVSYIYQALAAKTNTQY